MRRWLAAAATLGALGAQAQADPRWYVQLDNDSFFDTDRWFSSGARIARVATAGPEATEWALVHEIFSPEGKHYAPGVVDRAPTARVRGSFAWHRQDESVFQTVELGLGVRGRGAQGERITDAIHRYVSAARVDWSREVPSEADASAAITRTHAFGPLAVHYGALAGNEMTFAHAGFELHTGGADGVYSPALRFVATPPFAIAAPASSAITGFIGANVRRVARNRLLDLPYGVDTERPARKDWVSRAAIGVTAARPWGALVLALVQESREFAQQRTPQRYGSLVLHVPF